MFRPCRSRQFLRITFLVTLFLFAISLLHNFKGRNIYSFYHNEPELKYRKPSINLVEVTSSAFTPPEQNNLNLNNNDKNNDDSNDVEEEEWELDNENIPELSVLTGQKKGGPKHLSSTCAKFPDLYTVQFSNVHWQIQETKNETYYLYSAYLDLRGQKSPSNPVLHDGKVRVLAMSDARPLTTENATVKVCQYWFANKVQPIFAKIVEVRLVWNIKWGRTGHYYPYLITCEIPSDLKEVPLSVSLVNDKCDHATNNLNIMHKERADQSLEERTPQKNFAVCVKALDFPDDKMGPRLVEWIEMLRILGADKIFLYEYFVDSEIKKILDYYEKQGVIDVQQTTLPGELPNQPQLRHLYIRGKKLDKRLTELIPYNDCLYRHMYDYKYVLVVDTDELIIPTEDISWLELLNLINRKDIGTSALAKEPMSTYCFRNFYYLDGMMTEKVNEVSEIPPEFHILRHIYRSRENTGTRYMKCFHSTEFTAGVHNHFAFFCKDDQRCKRHYVDGKRAVMNHYRETCVTDIKNCSQYLLDTEKDTTLWRYKDELIPRVQTVLSNVT